MSIPILTQEAMAAERNIQSVSGASYTSAGFIQSCRALSPSWESDEHRHLNPTSWTLRREEVVMVPCRARSLR